MGLPAFGVSGYPLQVHVAPPLRSGATAGFTLLSLTHLFFLGGEDKKK